jgi:hypothetical protein
VRLLCAGCCAPAVVRLLCAGCCAPAVVRLLCADCCAPTVVRRLSCGCCAPAVVRRLSCGCCAPAVVRRLSCGCCAPTVVRRLSCVDGRASAVGGVDQGLCRRRCSMRPGWWSGLGWYSQCASTNVNGAGRQRRTTPSGWWCWTHCRSGRASRRLYCAEPQCVGRLGVDQDLCRRRCSMRPGWRSGLTGMRGVHRPTSTGWVSRGGPRSPAGGGQRAAGCASRRPPDADHQLPTAG